MLARDVVVGGMVCLGVALGVRSVEAGTSPCDLRPFQSVDNGVGAEPGVMREFTSGIPVPPECLLGGRTWIPRMGVSLTRTAGGPADVVFRILGRRPLEGGGGIAPPGDVLWGDHAVMANDVPIFPSSAYYTFDTVGPDGNVNNVLWGDYYYVGAILDGDTAPQVFITSDLVGTPGEVPCYTGINGAIPDDPCTTGQPNLNAVGLGARTYTFYGRYTAGDQVMGNREPATTTFAARYLSGQQRAPEGTGVDLRFRQGPAGPVICEYFDVPPDFEADCVMTAPQIDLLAAGGVFAELTVGTAAPETVRMIPADLFVFADGFESGDTAAWAVTVQ